MVAMGYIGEEDSLGLEGVGVVRSVGDGPHHQDFRQGDRICFLGEGLFQTTKVVKSASCVKLPPNMNLEDAATIPCVYSTVIYSLLDIGALKKGQVNQSRIRAAERKLTRCKVCVDPFSLWWSRDSCNRAVQNGGRRGMY
jgi:threonine dehydrogenase-like Zn-dependent dehydrogenase